MTNIKYYYGKGMQILNDRKFKKIFRLKKIYCKHDPVGIGADISNICNMSCDFCPYHGKNVTELYKPTKPFMDGKLLERILTTFKLSRAISFGMSGEPLVHPNYRDMVRIVQKIRPDINLTTSTNGLRLGKMNFDETFNYPVFKKVNVSIDTLDAKTHEKWSRRKGSLETVLQNLQSLCDWSKGNHLSVEASFVIPRSRIKNIEKYISYMQDFDIKYLGFQNYIPPNGIGNDTLTTNDIKELEYLREIKGMESKFRVGLINPIDMDRKSNFCPQPWSQITINPESYISPCCNIPRNVIFGKFETKVIWNSNTLMESRRKLGRNELPYQLCEFCWANQDQSKRLFIDGVQ